MKWFFIWSLLLGLLAGPPSVAQTSHVVVVIEVDGVINPLTAEYLQRALRRAEATEAAALIVMLDTPGGLESAMRDMVQQILEAPLPVVVYVYPQGARATSAGMFITLAGHVAAMAPATHIGAAHPVPLGGQLDEVTAEKLASDAAALIRGVAAARGRNVEWAEKAVRENLSLTAEEALQEKVTDLVADDLQELLLRIDGRRVTTVRGEITLHTSGANIERMGMNFIERLMHLISDPNIAYLLLSAGALFLLAELSDPGLGVGAVGSAICFILAFLALGSLPVNWAGAALLAAGVVLFVVALLTDADAVVTILALVPFILGSLLLFSPFTPRSPAMPDLRVSPWLIAGSSLALAAFSFVVLRAIVKAARMPPRSGAERLLGMRGVALTDVAPTGQVRVDLQDWSAVAKDDWVKAGQPVRVVGVVGVRLEVEPIEEFDKPSDGA
ncbi:MAG: nodulation protein NfeD [Chloroflexi bacterium]|nr:nodulation protein NfeD [Chloroflexota bacterium]